VTTVPLGNLDAIRDWGFAGDYMQAVHLIPQQEEPKDYVVGSRAMHSVRDAVQLAFGAVGLKGQDHVVTDADLIRPAKVETLCANTERARRELDQQPRIEFEEPMMMMVESDLALLAYAQKYGMRVGKGDA
jgi:GDPmannose 4,6-dehydratase